MVPPKKPQTDIGNNGNKRDLSNMPYNKRDSAMGGKADGKGQNGMPINIPVIRKGDTDCI